MGVVVGGGLVVVRVVVVRVLRGLGVGGFLADSSRSQDGGGESSRFEPISQSAASILKKNWRGKRTPPKRLMTTPFKGGIRG